MGFEVIFATIFYVILGISSLIGIFALEIIVAALQAYVFAILTAIYLSDAIHLHH